MRSHGLGKRTEEKWRFRNRTEVSLGDRVFLLRQGKAGPAVIGYGKVAGEPENNNGTCLTLVQFESIVDSTTKVLANREELLAIDGGQPFWRAQSSGVRLPESVASELEALVVERSPKPNGEESTSNPDWTRDELILALNVYLKHRPSPAGQGKPRDC